MLWMRFLLHLLPLRPSATISSATKALYRRQRQRHGSHQSPSFIEFPTQHTAQVLVLGLGHMASSNLEVFLEAATPHLPWRSAPMDRFPGGADDVWQLDKQKQDAAVVDYFTLEDLWEHYSESSAYGLSVPLRLQNGGFITQHFVPYLSAVQIYTSKTFGVPSSRSMGISDETSSDSWSDDDSTSAETKLSWDDDDDADASASDDDPPCPRQELQFHYTEWDPPYERIPLADKVAELAQDYPSLTSLTSAELSPSSWLSVAWYPIYHIPYHGSLKGSSACFLTYHSISSVFQDKFVHSSGGSRSVGVSPFGLATYRMEGKLWTTIAADSRLSDDLYGAASSWVKQVGAHHPDFNFFTSRSHPRIVTRLLLSGQDYANAIGSRF